MIYIIYEHCRFINFCDLNVGEFGMSYVRRYLLSQVVSLVFWFHVWCISQIEGHSQKLKNLQCTDTAQKNTIQQVTNFQVLSTGGYDAEIEDIF